MTAPVYTLQLHFQGISLWVQRDDYVDVLFPNDGQPGDEHHTTTIQVKDNRAYSFDNTVLDLRIFGARWLRPRTTSLDIAGWVQETLDPSAPARREEAVFDRSTCLSAVRLPLGSVMPLPLSRLIGPFSYKGDTSIFLGYGMLWQCSFAGESPLEGDIRASHDQILRRFSLGSPDTDTRLVEVEFTCLSEHDRSNANDVIKPGDYITEYETLYRLTSDGSRTLPNVPQYIGGTISDSQIRRRQKHSARITNNLEMFVSPRKPCPPAWADARGRQPTEKG